MSTLRRANTLRYQQAELVPARERRSRMANVPEYAYHPPADVPPPPKEDLEPPGHFKPPEDMSAQYREWINELNACIVYLQDPNFERIDKAEQIDKLIEYWLENFYQLNIDDKGLSRADVLFIVLCFLMACDRGSEMGELQPLKSLKCLYNRVVMFSCNHNCQAKMAFPTTSEIRNLENDACGFIVQHFYSTQHHVENCSRLIQDTKYERHLEETKNKPTYEHKMFEFDELPQDLRVLKQNLFTQDETKPNSNLGWLWQQSGIQMLTTFVPLCSRVFSHLYRERRLLQAWPLRQLPAIPRVAVDRLQKWLVAQASIEAEDEMRPKFIELVHELQIPMGARLQTTRRLVTRDDHDNAVNVLERELGYDTTFRLSEMAKTKPEHIAGNPKHDHYEALLLTVWDARLVQNKKTQFIADYFVLPTALPILKQLKHKQFSQTVECGQARRPLLIFLRRKWMLHFKESWYQCDSCTEALLGWVRFVVEAYGGELPNSGGINIKADYYNPFFELNEEKEDTLMQDVFL